MKIQIDTDNKVIKVLGRIPLVGLLKNLKKMLGEDYEKYSIESSDEPVYYPWIYPTITCSTGGYNLEFSNNNLL